MGRGARVGGAVVLAMAAACSSGSLSAPARQVEGRSPAARDLGVVAVPPAPAVEAVIQSLPYPARTVWGGRGQTLGFVAQGACETTFYDVVAGRVVAQLPACDVSADPRGDGFLVRYSTGRVDLWSPHAPLVTSLPSGPAAAFPTWSPDGAHLAFLGSDTIQLVDPATGQTVRRIHVEGSHDLGMVGYGADPVGWSADATHVFVGEPGRMWIVGLGPDDAQTQVDCPPTRAQFAPRGDRLAVVCTGSQDAQVWDARERRVVATLPRFARWSSTGRYAAAIDSTVQVLDAATGAVALRIGVASGTLAFSPDDTWLAVQQQNAWGNYQLVVWDITAGKEVARLDDLVGPAWSGDGAYLAAQRTRSPGHVVVVESGTWKESWSREGRYGEWTWSPVAGRLALPSPTAGLDVVDVHTGESRAVEATEATRFTRLEVAPDGAVVAHLQPRAWGGRDGSACEALRTDATGRASVVATACDVPMGGLPSPDGAKTTAFGSQAPQPALMAPRLHLFVEDTSTRDRWFVSSDWGLLAGQLTLWSARGHRLLVAGARPLLYEADTHRIWALREPGIAWAIDGDGRRAAAAQRDGTVRVTTLESHDGPIALPAASDQASLLALAGERLAAVTRSGSVTVWDVARREITASWESGVAPTQIAWGGDGAFLAIADAARIRISRPDGKGTVTLTALRTPGATGWLARDEQGAIDGAPEALGAVRFRVTDGAETWLDAASLEKSPYPSPLRPGLVEALVSTRQ